MPEVDPFLRGGICEGLRGSCPSGAAAHRPAHGSADGMARMESINVGRRRTGTLVDGRTADRLVLGAKTPGHQGHRQAPVICEFATWTRGATRSPSLTAS